MLVTCYDMPTLQLGLHCSEKMASSSRFPQPRPQAGLAQARQAHPASGAKVLTTV